jgi:hypothetical protein
VLTSQAQQNPPPWYYCRSNKKKAKANQKNPHEPNKKLSLELYRRSNKKNCESQTKIA